MDYGMRPWEPKRIFPRGQGFYLENMIYNNCTQCNLLFPSDAITPVASPVCNDCLVDIFIPMLEHKYKEKGLSKYIEEFIR
jgi:hypothetical protein